MGVLSLAPPKALLCPKVGGVKALGEPIVYWKKKVASIRQPVLDK